MQREAGQNQSRVSKRREDGQVRQWYRPNYAYASVKSPSGKREWLSFI